MQARLHADGEKPSQRNDDAEPNWAFVLVVGALSLVWLAGVLAPPPKIRATRISSVNNVAKVWIVTTGASAISNITADPVKWNREQK
ncbi:MAG TPA: hypothetical protein VL361_25660 [Candidatus Limnocylindrales bacterium]|nr:hypothetical protein [Candidatus Limnocylindrales bacterium]